ncbi:PepSY-associated TM helix domain-containing protein [Neptunomonas marina]|uniref:Peptidase n=1 Tax=Neptunomonas marina TaxID=1815562 RepID=A0A437Q831_9GAMM|nr:PepSY-associated TM helix domain-containing protein [Neptunomonas marina]RVU30639.1 hypothetical protein EOE65_10005 [Neptunomonas marina]
MTHRNSRSAAAARKGTSARLARVIHLYTSMFMLVVMLFFTITGLTLNHRDWFEGKTQPAQRELQLPDRLVQQNWQSEPLDAAADVRRWLRDEHQFYGHQVGYDWDGEEQWLVVDVRRPGGMSIAEVDVHSGAVLLEHSQFGVVAALNDLHMGRYSGPIWSLFIDLSVLMLLVFTLSGFWLVLGQRRKRARLFMLSGGGCALMAAFYFTVLV